MKWRTFLILISIILAIIYSIFSTIILGNAPWDWYNNLIATLLSFLLAVATGFFLYEKQVQNADKRQKADLCFLLQQELSDHVRILSGGERMTINFPNAKVEAIITFVQPLVIEKAAQSGLFDSVVTANLIHLARKIHTFNLKVQFLMAAINSPNDRNQQERISFAARNIEETLQSLLLSFNLVAKQIGVEIIQMEN